MTEPASVLFAAHCKARDLKPAQQVKLVLGYLVVRLLFPHITFADYLTASDRLLGATDENRLFPKDALDHWMPTKGSKFPPEDRIKFMTTYIDYAASAGEAALSFDEFLAAMQPSAVSPPAVSPPAAAAPPPAPAAAPAAAPPVPPVSPSPVAPVPVDASLPVVILQISADERRRAAEYFALGSSVGGVPIGESLLSWLIDCYEGKLHVDVVNGEPRPSVDIYFERNGEVVADMPVDTLCTDIINNYVIRGATAAFAVQIETK